MAIDTTVTLKRQIAELSEWSTAHPMVNDFGYGQYLETYRSSENKYLALIVNSPTLTSEDFFVNYQWEVICLDYVLDQKENMQRVLSDTQDVLRDLENTIRYSKRWKNFSRADGQWSYRRVDEFGADKCYGWIATFTLKIKKKHGICDISSLMPTYDFEVGSVVYPTCDPVTFAINGTDEDSFASGAEFDLTLVDTDGNTPVYSYDDVLKKLTVPASVACDPVSVTFNTVPVTSTPAGQTKAVTNKDTAGANVGTVTTDTTGVLAIETSDSTLNLKNTLGALIQTETLKAEETKDGEIADVDWTDSDGTPQSTPYGNTIVCAVAIPSGPPYKTGQTISQTAGDDGDTERGTGASISTLSWNNPYGNTTRFLDILGGTAFADDIVIDWSTQNVIAGTVLGWYRIPATGKTFAQAMSDQQAGITHSGFTLWKIPNVAELFSLCNYQVPGTTDLINYAPFNIDQPASAQRLWTCTNGGQAICLIENGGITVVTKTNSQMYIPCRYFTLAELGL